MFQYDVVLLTESRYVKPPDLNWYIKQILREDQLLTEALEKLGLRVFRTDWENPDFDWHSTHCAVFRTTWDYFYKVNKFNRWLDMVSEETCLINPVEQIRWNMDKHYLLDLADKGINIPESHFIEKGTKTTLEKVHANLGWEETVLKPAVSGAGRHTYRLEASNFKNHEEIFQELVQKEAVVLQVYQNKITSRGEVALMFFDGEYTHAVLKKAKSGDFRVQDDFGGTVHDYTASDEEISFARKVVSLCQPLPTYARVDILYDNEGKIALSELELIEPELWFRKYPPAADKMAEAILHVLEAA